VSRSKIQTRNFFSEKAKASFLHKGLYVLLFFKIIFSLQAAKISYGIFLVSFSTLWSKIVYFPLVLSAYNFELFYFTLAAIVLISIFLPVNFFCALLNFWISALVIRLTIHFTAGPDLVLRSFLFISIFLTSIPGFLKLVYLQNLIFDFGVIIGRIQICLIYFISGVDKIATREWRNGQAMFAVFQRDYMIIELFRKDYGSLVNISLGWMVILFEILFFVLIWFRPFKVPMIILGIVFHLFIAIVLSLPDFGFLLIITYLFFFLKIEQDWFFFGRKFKPA